MTNPWATQAEEQVQFPILIRLVTNPFEKNRLMASPENDLLEGMATNGPWRDLIKDKADAYDLVIDLFTVETGEHGRVFKGGDNACNAFVIRSKARRKGSAVWVDRGFTCNYNLAKILNKYKCTLRVKPFSNPWG